MHVAQKNKIKLVETSIPSTTDGLLKDKYTEWATLENYY